MGRRLADAQKIATSTSLGKTNKVTLRLRLAQHTSQVTPHQSNPSTRKSGWSLHFVEDLAHFGKILANLLRTEAWAGMHVVHEQGKN